MGRLEHWRDVWRRFQGRGTYPHQLAFVLTFPLRGLLLSPRKLIARMRPRPDAHVLEIGCGPGYFSADVARSVPSGRLVLFDIQGEMLARARARLRGRGVGNADFVRGDAGELPFRPTTFDLAFLVTVLGEVTDAGACIRSIRRALKPGGVLSVTEMRGDPDVLSSADVGAMATSNGFEPDELFETRLGFTANFRASIR